MQNGGRKEKSYICDLKCKNIEKIGENWRKIKMFKNYVKKLIQTMKKDEVELVSAEFSTCFLASPSAYDSGVIWSLCKTMWDAVSV